MERPVVPTSDRQRRWGHVAATAASAAALALLAAAAWTGCTVTESNYRSLSFFFDGVPDPRVPLGPDGQPLAPSDPRRSPTFVIHVPYAEDNCDACHQGRMRMSRRDSDVCLKCHEAARSGHEHMHGPVAAGECLWCHNPHESAYASLMKDTDRRVCTTCHAPGMLHGERVPAHGDPARGCLECHSGHGGSAPFMLKEGVAPIGDGHAEPAPGAGTRRGER
jgi:predicted CXXCH cytochrome family protein